MISWPEFYHYFDTTDQQEGFAGANAFESSFFEILDLANLVLFYVSLAYRMSWHMSAQVTEYDLSKAVTNYYDVQSLAKFAIFQSEILGCNALITALKLLKYFQTQVAINSVWQTILLAGPHIGYFFVIFVCVFGMFMFMGIVLYGYELRGYSDISESWNTLLRILLGQFHYEPLKEVQPNISMLYFLSFIFLVYLTLVNMLLAIIGNAYRRNMVAQTMQTAIIKNHVERTKSLFKRRWKKIWDKQHMDPDEQLRLTEGSVPSLLREEDMTIVEYVGHVGHVISARANKYWTSAATVMDTLTEEIHFLKQKQAAEEEDELVTPNEGVPQSHSFAMEQLKGMGELGLLKMAAARVKNETKHRGNATSVSFGQASPEGNSTAVVHVDDSPDHVSASPETGVSDRRHTQRNTFRESSRASLRESEYLAKQAEQDVERLVDGGVGELRGEVEALRGHYASLIANDTWEPLDHERIAAQLDAVAEAARILGATSIEEEATVVASGVRHMLKKIADLGDPLL